MYYANVRVQNKVYTEGMYYTRGEANMACMTIRNQLGKRKGVRIYPSKRASNEWYAENGTIQDREFQAQQLLLGGPVSANSGSLGYHTYTSQPQVLPEPDPQNERVTIKNSGKRITSDSDRPDIKYVELETTESYEPTQTKKTETFGDVLVAFVLCCLVGIAGFFAFCILAVIFASL